jgi:alkylhydroperoxidase family enzyme
MAHFSYSDAGLQLPDRIAKAHRQAWERLASPGNGWSGAERVAMAAALRGANACGLCRERKQALSPGAVAGHHDHDGVLPEAVVEAIHRIITDPSRLSRTWYEKTLTEGLSDAQYVELVGLVVAVFSIDEFHRALGLPYEPLPEPIAGAPEPYRPANVTLDVAWVPMIPAGKLAAAESDLWPANRTGNVLRALSLVPAAVRQLKDLSAVHYLSAEEMLDLGIRRAIDRAQMELIAGRVSALNECFY